ncbi:MAG: methyltransferase domain-containing protein [Pseudomonadota bacterium]
MLDHASEIKSMKLYTHIDRVRRELDAIGKDSSADLDAAEISAFDQMHYHGTVAVDHAIDMMEIGSDSSVLEIGSGFGGPARHIANRTGAKVTAVELQQDQNDLAAELTDRCHLAHLIDHVAGDFLSQQWEQRFDGIVSWLAIFHIAERDTLLRSSREILKPGGLFFAEDMYSRSPMDDVERDELGRGMYAAYLPDWDTYQKDFTDQGFDLIRCDEMSDDWTDFTTNRLADYRAARERHVQIHNEATYNAMEEFYDLVNRHFRSGKLGGVRILARKR